MFDRRHRYAFGGHYLLLTCTLLLLITSAASADTRICNWNLLHFSTSASDRYPAYRTVLSALNPDVIIVEEIANSGAVSAFLNSVLNHVDGPGGFSAATFTDTGDSLDNALFYRSSKMTFTGGYVVIAGTPRDLYRWQLRPVADPSGASDLYVYSMHLAATDPDQRLGQTTAVRNNANTFAAGTNFIFAGDFNIPSSSEPSYQALVGSQADNDGRGFDPINMPGAWSANMAFKCIHTQSPHNNNPGANGGAVGGGMDDRYDFLLVSAALQNGSGLDYVAGSYHAFGNDCNHYNNDINDPPTIPEGAAMADALHAASDHLPVYLDLSGPVSQPTINSIPPAFFPLVLVGAPSTKDITVKNNSPAPGADLTYSFIAPPDFTAPAGTFNSPAGSSGNIHTITMDTSTSGNKGGVLQIPNNSTNAPARTVNLSGGVLDHAIPSTVVNSQVITAPLDFGSHSIGGFSDQTARVYNANYVDGVSVTLDVYSASITADAEGRFSLVSFVPTAGIDSYADFAVHFDDTGAAGGAHTATLQFLTRDDSNLPGNMNLATITYNLTASISCTGGTQGDFDGLNGVDMNDVDPFVAIVLDPDAATPEDRCLADMNSDGLVNGADVQDFTDALAP